MELKLRDGIATAEERVRADDEIYRDIVDQVVRRVLVAEDGKVRVEVADGVVTLIGLLDRRSDADDTVRLSRRVPGVIGVVDHLGWERDDL